MGCNCAQRHSGRNFRRLGIQQRQRITGVTSRINRPTPIVNRGITQRQGRSRPNNQSLDRLMQIKKINEAKQVSQKKANIKARKNKQYVALKVKQQQQNRLIRKKPVKPRKKGNKSIKPNIVGVAQAKPKPKAKAPVQTQNKPKQKPRPKIKAKPKAIVNKQNKR